MEERGCSTRLREAAKSAVRIGKLSERDYLKLMEWGRLKRVLAEAAAACIREMLSGERVDVYFVDLTGGERAEVAGRDVDLVVVVDDAVVDKVRDKIERALNELIDKAAPGLRDIVGGKEVFEVHVVGRSSPQFQSLIKSRYAPPIRL